MAIFNDVQSLIEKTFTETDKALSWNAIGKVPPRNENGTIRGYPDQYEDYVDDVIKYEISLGIRHPELHDPLNNFMFQAGVPIQ